MVLSLVVPFAAGKLLMEEVMDEIVLGQSSVGFRPSEAPRRFKQKAISITQASPGLECSNCMASQRTLQSASVAPCCL
jgi:hypothetical protein